MFIYVLLPDEGHERVTCLAYLSCHQG